CLFDGNGTPVLTERAPAGGTCRTKPCWTASPVRYAYRDPERTPDGIDRLELVAGADGDARVYVKSKGPAVALPAFPLPLPVTVQLHRENGDCWARRTLRRRSRRTGPRPSAASRYNSGGTHAASPLQSSRRCGGDFRHDAATPDGDRLLAQPRVPRHRLQARLPGPC